MRRGDAAPPRLLSPGEQPSQIVIGLDVGHRIGARRAADRALIDERDVGQTVEASQLVAGSRLDVDDAARPLVGAVEDVLHQRRLAGARHAGDGDQRVERELDVDAGEVVRARAANGDARARSELLLDAAATTFAPEAGEMGTRRRRRPPRQEQRRERFFVREHQLRRSLGDHLAAPFPGSRTEIDQPVRAPDQDRVVLDDEHRVAPRREIGEQLEQLRAIARVQSDRRFVEDVEGRGQTGAERRGEMDSLRLAAR